MKYLIAGLGNPGAEYAFTRHNIGFMVLDRWAHRLGGAAFRLDRHGLVTEVSFRGRAAVLLKPTTYMNLSGQAVRHWLGQEKLATERLIVVTDDIALDFGRARLRSKGSAGGHNGLTSIEQLLATQEYARLRLGVGANFSKGRQADYVLSPFAADEMPSLIPFLDGACNILEGILLEGLERAASRIPPSLIQTAS